MRDMNHRTPRILGALMLALSLVATTLVSTVLAAQPRWEASLVASPGQVTAGDYVQLVASFRNMGPSNISQLYLTLPTPTNTTYLAGSLVAPSPLICQEPTATTSLMCTYGAVTPSTNPIVVTAIYLTAAGQTTAATTASWTSTGNTGSDGGTSHGDSLARPLSFSLVTATTTSNFAGRYVVTPSQRTVANGPALGNSNKQSTQVTVTITGLPVTVLDGFKGCDNGLEETCPTGIFGETSEINVNNGADTPIQVTIVEYKTVNAAKVHGVYHSWLGSDNAIHSENITDVCGTQPAGEPCYRATDLSSQLLQLYVEINHNGRINGW
ncbi:MAG: hypothetical protein M3P14_06500 [Chloroflexota bacterium]|nr:hypothetical protein [Chloroflexota bacterium]